MKHIRGRGRGIYTTFSDSLKNDSAADIQCSYFGVLVFNMECWYFHECCSRMMTNKCMNSDRRWYEILKDNQLQRQWYCMTSLGCNEWLVYKSMTNSRKLWERVLIMRSSAEHECWTNRSLTNKNANQSLEFCLLSFLKKCSEIHDTIRIFYFSIDESEVAMWRVAAWTGTDWLRILPL